jgi:hypothetical protein
MFYIEGAYATTQNGRPKGYFIFNRCGDSQSSPQGSYGERPKYGGRIKGSRADVVEEGRKGGIGKEVKWDRKAK